MGYWNAVAKDDEQETKDDGVKVDSYAIIQFVVACLIAVFSFIAGAYSHEWNGEAAIVKDCKENYAPSYAKGVVDQTLRHVNQFILNCTPTNVEAFVMVAPVTNKPIGTIFRCNESLLPLRFAR